MAHVQGSHIGLWKPQDLSLDKINSQKIFIDNIDMLEAFALSVLKRSAAPVLTVEALRAVNTSDISIYTDGTIIMVKSRGIYYFDRGSLAADNGTTIIAPTTGGGRWIFGNKTIQEEINKMPKYVNGEIGTTAYLRLTGYQILDGKDLNTIKFAGQYGVMSSCINKPSEHHSYGMLEIIMYSSDWLIQRYYAIDNIGVIYGVWYRSCYNTNSWTPWVKYSMGTTANTLANAEVVEE